MPRFEHDGLSLHYLDRGEGVPFVFQHGLGATAAQPSEVTPAGVRSITLECRGHGESETGEHGALSIETFAADLAALLDHLAVDRPILGGISMGAAIALRLAVQRPGRFRGLVFARPAWVTDPAPPNMAVFAVAAAHMAPGGGGREAFERSAAYRDLAAASPDNAASILGQFDAPDLIARAALLSRIAADGPGVRATDLAPLADLPTLVIGNDHDAVHPAPMARDLAALIPAANYREITSKSVSRDAYAREFRAALAQFVAGLSDG